MLIIFTLRLVLGETIMAQLSPPKPALHWHFPEKQNPLPVQSSGHRWLSQDFPKKPASQTHAPEAHMP
jgi:hypothetical protein